MNNKQLITMWCGIAAIVLAGLTVIEYYGLVCFYGFSVWVFIVALMTSGLIYTLRDKAGRKLKNEIQDIRGNLLRKKRSKMDKNSPFEDKLPAFSTKLIL
jgi:hypothetical protein